jgi:hypothetical protein
MPFVLNDQQRESLEAMISRERDGYIRTENDMVLHSRLGINGNAVGSGKTRSMLALVYQDLQTPHMNNRPYVQVTSHGLLSYNEETLPNQHVHPTTLVLANGSIRRQWIRELKEANCLRYVLIDNVRRLESFVPSETDVAIISNTVYKKIVSMGYIWRRFIYDETDSYLFQGMSFLHSSFTWFVTATWEELYRFTRGSLSVRHVNTLRRILAGVPLPQLVVCVPSQLGLPIIEEHNHLCRRAVSIASAVAGYIEPDVMMQIETGDIHGAIQALGGDASTTNIVDLVRTRLERSLQEANLRIQLNRNREVWCLRAEQLQRDIGLVNDRFQSILTDEQCSVCMESFSNPILTPCHHVFCLQCIVPWFEHQHTCPQCRTPLRPDQVTTLCSRKHEETLEHKPVTHTTYTRMEHLERLLSQRSPDQRILIFSEHDVSLDTIQSVLHNQPYGVVRGHSSSRAMSIEQFKSGERPILLLNSRMNGAGIDLPETTDIILFHPMHHTLETQAIGRGQRLGRTSTLHVHRFV